uniref:Uncharacterized protein n=1 Tax=Rhizophagus irregularis (strain DAOM 181602 / DAOM 197198 / MUCL 43194) TaxID=747089 RepID=U9TVS4_RHIID
MSSKKKNYVQWEKKPERIKEYICTYTVKLYSKDHDAIVAQQYSVKAEMSSAKNINY